MPFPRYKNVTNSFIFCVSGLPGGAFVRLICLLLVDKNHAASMSFADGRMVVLSRTVLSSVVSSSWSTVRAWSRVVAVVPNWSAAVAWRWAWTVVAVSRTSVCVAGWCVSSCTGYRPASLCLTNISSFSWLRPLLVFHRCCCRWCDGGVVEQREFAFGVGSHSHHRQDD